MAQQRASGFGALYAVVMLSISSLCRGGGFPVCPPGLLSCGTSGCYSRILTRCVGGQCRGILASVGSFLSLPTATGPCPVKYSNACGDNLCDINEVCLLNKCAPATPSNNSQYRTSTLAAAAGVTANMSALETCRAARTAYEVCSNDTTQLSVVDCSSIGVGWVPGVTCLQSRLFNCATAPGLAPFYTCRGMAVLRDAVSEVLGDRLQNVSKPILQPVFQNVATWAGNLSEKVLNVTLPATQAVSSSFSNLLSSSRANSSSSGFVLVPPDGISGAGNQRCLSLTVLVGLLSLHLLL